MSQAMERMHVLLCERATEGLSKADARELEGLLVDHEDWSKEGLERAAAAVHLALVGPEYDALPVAIEERLRSTSSADEHQSPVLDFPTPQPQQLDSSRRSGSGWLAAAACLVLAVVGWWPRLQPAPPIDIPPVPLTITQERDRLLAEAPDVATIAWAATEDLAAQGAAGDVVWSPSRQKGYMRFRNLEVNNPTETQYQLWIFDKTRDERYPVDGGVFDVPAGSTEFVVPIDAKILVDEPTLFAVTVEPPGGVVVSERERVVLVASA